MQTRTPQDKAAKLMQVLISMGTLTAPPVDPRGFRLRTPNDRRGKQGSGMGKKAPIPDQAEAEAFCRAEDAKTEAEYQRGRIPPAPYHGDALQKSRDLITQRRKEVKRTGKARTLKESYAAYPGWCVKTKKAEAVQ